MIFDDNKNEQDSKQRSSLTGLSIAAGLRAAAHEVSSKNDRDGLLKLSLALESGATLNGALENVPGLPEDLRQIVMAGVSTGRLPLLLEEYLEANRQTRTLWRSFYMSLLYPALVAICSFIIVIAFLVLTVPQFRPLFEDFGVELPVITEFVIRFADFLTIIWLPLAIFGAVLVGYVLLQESLPFGHLRAQVFHALPWVGTAQKMAASSEFCSRLAVLVECRMPLDQALRIASKTIRDPFMSHIASQLSGRIGQGDSVEEIAATTHGIPHSLSNSFRWARNPETFAESLRSLAIVFSSQARLSAGQLILIAEPVAFIIVALFSGMIVIAMFMPLIKLLNALS